MMRVWAVAVKELLQIRRDRRTMLILLFIPAFFLFLYGYALNFDIRHVTLAVEDRDESAESRALIASFVESTYFDIAATVTSPADADRLMDRGTVRAIMIIPEGFSRELREGDIADVQVLLDGDNANTATTVMGYATAVLREASARLGANARLTAVGAVGLQPRVWYNPELRSTLFLVPGLIAYILMITAVISTALSVVREKESGTMEQIRMAPIDTLSFVVGKSIPYFFISLASAALIIFAAMLLFALPMRGNWLALLLALSLFIAGALGTGLLISTVAETQQVAFQAAMLSSFLPTLMLSGFIFPISSMPYALQLITHIVPARYFLIALRGIVLKGTPLRLLWPQMVALSIYALLMLTFSSVRLARERH